jgi:tetratricopeptide (TPR) repeat protein
MDQDKSPKENLEQTDSEFDNIEFSEFDEVENLDDFFDDEGQSGADVFESDASTDDDSFEQATADEIKKAKKDKFKSSGGSNFLKSAVSTIVVLAVIGGAGYFVFTNDSAKGFISDLTGMQIGDGEQMASNANRLAPDNNAGDPFATDISMDELSGQDGMSEDFPMPYPVANTQDVFNTDDGIFDGLPQPTPQNSTMENDAGADGFAEFDEFMEAPEPAVVSNAPSQPQAIMPAQERVTNNIQQAPMPAPTAVPPSMNKSAAKPMSDSGEIQSFQINEVASNSDVNDSGSGMNEASPFDSAAPLPTAEPSNDEPASIDALLGQAPAAVYDAAEEAEEVSRTFIEAKEDYLDLRPIRKPGYSIEVHAAGGIDSVGEYIPENEPKLAGAAAMSKPQVKAKIITEQDDDPLLVAAERAMQLERYESALRLYETLEIMNPNYSRALKGKADALRALGRLPEAELMYRKAKEIAPHDSEVDGAILGVQASTNPNSALNSLLLKHQQDQSNPNIAAQIAVSYAGIGDYERSYMFWQKANALKANNPVYLYNMAVAADKTGRAREAIALYEKALYVDGAFHQGKNIQRSNVYDRLTYLRSQTR